MIRIGIINLVYFHFSGLTNLIKMKIKFKKYLSFLSNKISTLHEDQIGQLKMSTFTLK